MPFEALNIIDPILKSLHEEGYRTPTPIQEQAIPIVLQGKDLLGVAQTGTGKTAAFAVPIIQLLTTNKPAGRKKNIRCLVLTPTRELAVQIEESFLAYGRHTHLSSVVIFGGVKQGQQTMALHRGVDIVVATPGRLLDLMDQGYVSLQHVEIFVLDEADRMLDMGFVRDVKQILAVLPQKRQSLFFSATMPPAIVSLAHDILDHPVKVSVTPPAATVDLIQQTLYYVDKARKMDLLIHLLEDRNIETALVFTRTKHGADVVVRNLLRNGIGAEAIHGNKAQNARQRALDNFKSRKTRVLVATDIAARGIDVDDLEYVINYEIPNVPETYVHRIGRTGRAGAEGNAISFCAPDEKAFVRDIEKLTRRHIPVARDGAIATMPSTKVAPAVPRGPAPGRGGAPARRGAPAGGGGQHANSGRPPAQGGVARHQQPPRGAQEHPSRGSQRPARDSNAQGDNRGPRPDNRGGQQGKPKPHSGGRPGGPKQGGGGRRRER